MAGTELRAYETLAMGEARTEESALIVRPAYRADLEQSGAIPGRLPLPELPMWPGRQHTRARAWDGSGTIPL